MHGSAQEEEEHLRERSRLTRGAPRSVSKRSEAESNKPLQQTSQDDRKTGARGSETRRAESVIDDALPGWAHVVSCGERRLRPASCSDAEP
jgi:hypothetical protein